MSSKETPRTIPCTECDLKFSTQRILRAHKELSHTQNFPCGNCQQIFGVERSLLSHMTDFHPPNRCSECSLVFSTQDMLQSHYKRVHLGEFPCTLCATALSSQKTLGSHLLAKHRGAILCISCMHAFANREALQKHEQAMHLECAQCNKYYDKDNLRDHHQATGHLYCDACEIHFQSVAAHTTHVRTIEHTTQCRCCDCDREYANQDALKNHCCDCDIVNPTHRRLTKHLASTAHAEKIDELEAKGLKGLKDFRGVRCDRCNHAAASEKSLARHKREVHKTIPCPSRGICFKKFVSPSALISHLESGRCPSGMTRIKLAETVFAHDTNRYITSIDAYPAVEESTRLERTINQEPKTPIRANQIPSLPIVETKGNPRYDLQLTAKKLPPAAHDNTVAKETRYENDDDDTASEWSLAGGAPLTPTSNDDEDNWSLISREQLTPDASDTISEWSTSGVLVATPTHSEPTSRRASLSSLTFPIFPTSLRCNLCPPDRKPFINHLALQMHMVSPAHSPAIFHCPISFLPNLKPEDMLKRRNFKTLGGLTQHLEKGACSGGLELYKLAMEFVQEKLEGLGIKGIQLLKI